MPAASSTRRCLVIAWRVRAEPSASREIDCGGPLDRFPISASRVSSPSAANTEARRVSAVPRSARAADMALDIDHLLGPAPLVHPKGFDAPVLGNGIEARLGEDEQSAAIDRLEPELDQGGWLARIVDRGVDGIGMPGEG